jgi:hypothetical protein
VDPEVLALVSIRPAAARRKLRREKSIRLIAYGSRRQLHPGKIWGLQARIFSASKPD